MATEDAGRPGTGEAAVAVLLGAGALAWRVAEGVTAPARWVLGASRRRWCARSPPGRPPRKAGPYARS